ncbi:MAG: carboxy terminal-processing peptidase [Verrucomicrobiota bacterium JB023]|nr:carboxy terminal-processing peptidase [Verrucomicrobiota bacterium JB023]
MKISTPLMALAVFAGCSGGLLTGKTDFNVVGKEMTLILQNKHYAKVDYDEELTDTILDDYLKDLDPAKMYFTADDVAVFREQFGGEGRTPLHKLLLQERCMEAAEPIYTRYAQRVKQRVEFAQQIARNARFTFDSDATVMRSRKDAPWATTENEVQDLWRRQIEEELLSEELRRENIRRIAEEQGKEDPLADEKSPREMIALRYERVLQTIQGADEEDVAAYFLSAVAQAHDPHTDYMSAREQERFEMGLRNELIGIGALLQAEDDGSTKIIGIVVNGPADKQGELQLNDRIIAVDSLNNGDVTDTLYMKIDHVVELIRGRRNSQVRLKVEPADGAPGEVRDIIITRDKVELKDEAANAQLIKEKAPDGSDRTIGWITLPSFYLDFNDGDPSVSKDVQKLLTRLIAEDIEGLVIDLRGNGGGALEEVRRITGFFTGRGPVVQVKSTYGRVDSKDSIIRRPIYDGPLVVLTDRTSASASEILAGALQDYNRAIVVGDSSTYGKGTVQQAMDINQLFKPFEDGSRAGSIKATVQKFYRVTGSSTQLEGVVPDIILPSLIDALEVGEKYQDHALPHDLIAPAAGYKPLEGNLFVDTIKARSQKRISNSKDFQYTLEDVKRTKERIESNAVSLNRETRRQELEESEERRRTRNAERRERFEKMESEDAKVFSFFRLTLDDLDNDSLEEVDIQRDSEANMKRAKSELEGLDDTPDWPSGMDPVKREGISVLHDLIELTEQAQVARVEQQNASATQ